MQINTIISKIRYFCIKSSNSPDRVESITGAASIIPINTVTPATTVIPIVTVETIGTKGQSSSQRTIDLTDSDITTTGDAAYNRHSALHKIHPKKPDF